MPVPGTARSGLIIPEDGRIRHVLESLENWSIWGIPADKGVLAEAGSGQETAAVVAQAEDKSPEDKPDIDDLKRSLEQIAASRERGRGSGDSWMKGLSPEQMQLIGDILKEYLG